MDTKQIKQYLRLMEANDLVEFELEEKDLKIKLVKRQAVIAAVAAAPMVAAAAAPAGDVPAAAPSAAAKSIDSPMVGTYYSAPSPGADEFIKVGDRIEKGKVVCIIEAMKVMNEIKADCSGIVRELLLENGEPVEYNQSIISVDPA